MEVLRLFFKNRLKSVMKSYDKLQDALSPFVDPIYKENASSLLHKEILVPAAESQVVETPSAGSKTKDQVPLSLRLNIGGRLAQSRTNILTQIDRLMPLAGAGAALGVDTWRTAIERQTCRIAFVGQINAGKSSLISSLVEKPDLLPASINPWTTVITNIHFGVPGTPEAGASFVFFTAEEWTRLSKGGRVRELTDRAFPNFNWSALQEQIETMQRRAEARLGPRFRSLLGTSHTYSEIAPDLLVRYVGAGSDGAHAPHGPEGEFSDITKLANVYFDLGPFLFPTILIDTPGINDPFLVRDEITRQCLDDVDVCVVVVTAKQPLSTSDLGLLRLLIGLDKRKVLIFVNKVDEIEANPETLGQIERTIRSLLDAEFPGYEFPVIFGSALWAREAIAAAQSAAEDDADMPGFFSLKPSQTIESWLEPDRFEAAMEPDRLMRRSGLIKLALTISDLVREGGIAEQLEHKTRVLEQLCDNLIACRGLLQDTYGPDASWARGREQLEALCQLHQAILAEVAHSRQGLDELLCTHMASLRELLAAALQDGIRSGIAEFPALRADIQLRSADRAIRRKLQEAFAAARERLMEAMRAGLGDAVRRLDQTVAAHGVGLGVVSPSSYDILLETPLSAAALNEPATLDIAELLGDHGIGSSLSDQMKDEISHALTANFEPIISELALRGEKSLKSVIDEVFLQIEMILVHPLEALIESLADAISRETELMATNSANPPAGFTPEMQRADIATLAAIKHEISCARMLLRDSS